MNKWISVQCIHKYMLQLYQKKLWEDMPLKTVCIISNLGGKMYES